MRKILCFVMIFCFGSALLSEAKSYKPDWKSLDNRPIPDWFQDAKFGIFIHWGVYSVPSFAPTKDVGIYARYAEWYWRRSTNQNEEGYAQFREFHDRVFGKDTHYQDFAPQFKAEMYDPAQWADVFKKAGARYVVLTSKHHDGFCLWPSRESWNWNAVDVGPHRDLAGDLSKAVKDAGLDMGFYYSLYEWYNPLYHADVDRYINETMWPQLKDLVNRYEPAVVWTDGEWDYPSERWKSEEFLAWLYNESPVKEYVAVNDRWGKETRSKHGGYYTTEYGLVHDAENAGESISHPWEECRGIGHSFGYNRAETLKDYSSSKKLIHMLAGLVSKGGNLLLDIGPTADGRIPVIMEERLLQIGAWLEVNGEAIYGTRSWKVFQENETVLYTSKGKDVYAICLEWPGPELLLKQPKTSSKTQVTLLGSENLLSWTKSGDGVTIQIPETLLKEMAGSHAWVVKMSDVK